MSVCKNIHIRSGNEHEKLTQSQIPHVPRPGFKPHTLQLSWWVPGQTNRWTTLDALLCFSQFLHKYSQWPAHLDHQKTHCNDGNPLCRWKQEARLVFLNGSVHGCGADVLSLIAVKARSKGAAKMFRFRFAHRSTSVSARAAGCQIKTKSQIEAFLGFILNSPSYTFAIISAAPFS